MGQAREVMDQVSDALMARDFEAVKEGYAADAIAVTPDGKEFKGGHEIVEYLRALFVAFPDARYDYIHKHESGEFAVDEGMFSGTHTGPLRAPDGGTIPATGRRMSMRSCDVVHVRDGLIRSHRFYFDQATMMEQLGLTLGE